MDGRMDREKKCECSVLKSPKRDSTEAKYLRDIHLGEASRVMPIFAVELLSCC